MMQNGEEETQGSKSGQETGGVTASMRFLLGLVPSSRHRGRAGRGDPGALSAEVEGRNDSVTDGSF